MDPNQIATGILQFFLLLFSLSVHECAHAVAAYRLGDDTAALQGRMTLNPVSHIDPIGTLLIPLSALFFNIPYLIGWARPVPTDPRRFSSYRKGQILVAAAGPASNVALAVVFLGGWAVYTHLVEPVTGSIAALHLLLVWGVLLNVILAAFNLLPVTPLDGSWIASHGLPREWGRWYDETIAPYGFYILIGLLVFGLLHYWLLPFLIVGEWLLRFVAHPLGL